MIIIIVKIPDADSARPDNAKKVVIFDHFLSGVESDEPKMTEYLNLLTVI